MSLCITCDNTKRVSGKFQPQPAAAARAAVTAAAAAVDAVQHIIIEEYT